MSHLLSVCTKKLVRLFSPNRRGAAACLFVAALAIALIFPAPQPASAQGRNILDTKNAPSSSPPRPKADREIVRSLNRSFETGFGPNSWRTNMIFIAFFFVLFAIVAGLIRYDMKYRQRLKSSYDDPKLLFRELCAAHKLTKAEKRFLRDLADELDLDDPLPLFIEPAHFHSALETDVFEEYRSTIHYLLEKLFDVSTDRDRVSDSFSGPETTLLRQNR